ncbi:acyltransferase ChoActase/COT/CPT [Guyanagaster necrorhizus]|uniref:Acyltransferase ChoActase/COT/CPT n=1 Tax=Guyanagaster necrorhizus TaxID=856835 RepID=A0A9P7VQ13_9AGAR|nr:acyltransferase ChoActase/COT/CPT [Guyanagaster necrorhizus MCA 3950]KAG7444677.1 acyltransferase ChoActase/COT/CPT [Guyanagaster necrorhizus MCA 3950]
MTTTTPTLLRLPVPALRKTLDKYLTSLEPFLLEDASKKGLDDDALDVSRRLRAQWADEFASGVGKLCQDRLLELDRASPNNWLDDNFWMNNAYMEWRAPLLINSNWWLAFEDDANIPVSEKERQDGHFKTGFSRWQIKRAAWLLHRILEFKIKLETQELYPDTTRTGIWLRESTSKMFNVARIPKHSCDVLSPVPLPTDPFAYNIVVMVHGWFYRVSVMESPSVSMDVGHLARYLEAVVSDAEQRLIDGEEPVSIGLLSADDRDKWSENFEHLLALSESNKMVHTTLSNSLMVLSLDNEIYEDPTSPNPSTKEYSFNSHLHVIRSTASNVGNRWFDKAFTLVVDPAARSGAVGEHSPCDALVPSIVAEYGIIQGINESHFENDSSLPSRGQRWDRLDWVVDDFIKEECGMAKKRAERIIEDSDDSVFWFSDYGVDWIKGAAKLAPDAFIQMALQVTWYKMRGQFTATYETALTRMFDKGRTETIRTLTRESRAFCLAMVDGRVTAESKRAALESAIKVHTRLTREAATGKGIDRHLMGLRQMLCPELREHTPLFEDPLFGQSSCWKLCTSGLSAGHLFRGTGFGAIYEDGYGINYLAGSSMIKFGIESKFSNSFTSTSAFISTLADVLRSMQNIFCLDIHSENVARTHL